MNIDLLSEMKKLNNNLENLIEKDKEIERLNNIIKQYEEYLISSFNTSQDTKYLDDLMKLKELKGSDKK